MNIAILGAGLAGNHLYKEIKKDGRHNVIFAVDNFVENFESGIKIYKSEEYLKLNADVIEASDITIIAVGAQKSLKAMIDLAEKRKLSEVYILHDIAGKNKLSLITDGKFNERWIKKLKLSEEKPVFPYIEIPITDLCNLNCKGCLFACNKDIQGTHVDYSQIKKDVKRLGALFSNVAWIRILGGEPLMHPDIKNILYMIRGEFPDSEIDLCTNGLLIPKMDDDFYKVVNENQISVHVSGYKPTYNLLPKIDMILSDKNINYTLLKREEFYKFYTLTDNHDRYDNFKKCPTCACRELYRGRIMNCSAAIAFEKFDEFYNTNYNVCKDADWFDIHDDKWDGFKLKEALENPNKICEFCDLDSKEMFEWDVASIDAMIEDYVINK